jgi:GTPase
MLIDRAEIIVKGGHGGAGLVSFGKMTRSGPDGGNGGRGGDLYVRAVSDITLLNQFSQETKFTGGRGGNGGQNKRTGKGGEDLELLLPIGTSLIDKETGEVVLELTEIGQRELLCEGGKGGRGNWEFRSSRNTTPMKAQPGLPGDVKHLIVELKLIAQYGFIGLPNAGKSSLLNEITNAHAKTANYAFTTLSPNLGVLNGKVIADIPGLIEGASDGRGLGISFLKHIEKVKVLLHAISVESKDPMKDYKTVRTELGNYSKALLKKEEVILLTKADLVDKKIIQKLEKRFLKKAKKVLPISIHDWESLEKLKKELV